MKLRYITPLILTFILSACNLSLAADVTPPPGYVPPTPVPTLVLIPARAPNAANGALIYAEKCLPCHGATGMGDGEKGIQLGVTVAAFGLPEIARLASPAQYFTTVTRGNIERFMPPFVSLNDQQRWDVIAYVLTLHTTPEQIEKGKQLFEANCKNCSTDFFKDQVNMSKLSEVELARLIREGNDKIPAFGAKFNDDDLWAVAAYLRTLSFDLAPLAALTTPLPSPTLVPPTQTLIASDAGTTVTASAEITPNGTEQATAVSEATQVVTAGFGMVTGVITNETGAELPSDLKVTLHGFEHDTGQNAGAKEVFSQDVIINPDGTFTVDNVELPEGRIFLAEMTYSGVKLQSEWAIVKAGETSLTLPPMTLYPLTNDFSTLTVDEVNIFISLSDASTYQVYVFYSFRNAGQTVVVVKSDGQQEISFLKFPDGAQGLGYETVQQGAQFVSMDTGFAIPPNKDAYGIVAFSSVAKQSKTTITQAFGLPAAIVRIFVPEGMKAKGDNLLEDSPQNIQGTVYQMYVAHGIAADGSLTFEVSGAPKGTGGISFNNPLLLGAGVLGLALIVAGGWMYWRDHKRSGDNEAEDTTDEEDEDDDEFSSSEEVLDAIIALDDLNRAKKISKEAYKKRRAELKARLKELM